MDAIAAPAAVFSISIDPAMLWGTGAEDPRETLAAPMSRELALRLPAVRRARDLIAGGIGQFPLNVYDPDGEIVTGDGVDTRLFDQPEVGVAPAVTMANLVEDLIMDKVGWWRKNAVNWFGRPVVVARLAPDVVNVLPEQVVYPEGVALVWPAEPNLVRFDSPNGGLLTQGRRALRALQALDSAAVRNASGLPPLEWFEPVDGVDPEPEDITELLADWKAAREKSSTAYIPAAFKYQTGGFNADQADLNEARTYAVAEIARLTGVDAEELSVSTTSRTYANMQDRRRNFVENVLGPYMRAIEQRLSMDDITPPGHTARFDTSAFLRLDDAAAASADKLLIDAGVLLKDEARDKRGLPPLPPEPDPAPAPAAAVVDPAEPDGADDASPTSASFSAVAFSVDAERRTLRGLVIPWGRVAKSRGALWRFSRGTLTLAQAEVLLGHDWSQFYGVATFEETAEGLEAVLELDPGPLGDRALRLIQNRIVRGLSAGLSDDATWTTDLTGVRDVTSGSLPEVSLTPSPAFDGAGVYDPEPAAAAA